MTFTRKQTSRILQMRRINLFFMLLLTSAFTALADNTLSVSNALVPQGRTGSFNINLSNTDTFLAYQMNLTLPDGITFVSAAKGNRYADDHSLGVATHGQTTTLTILSSTNQAITGNEGALLTITVEADAGIAAGTKLAAVLSNIELVQKVSETGRLQVHPDDVGFDIEVTDKVVLDENSPTVPIATDEAVNLLVRRTIKADEWSTLCLPFEMDGQQTVDAFGSDVQLAEFDSYEVNDDGTITVCFIDSDPAEGIYANWPYIIKTSQNVSEFEVTAVVESDEESAVAEYETGKGKNKKLMGTFTGTLHAGSVIPENNLFLNSNKFYYSTGKTKCKAFRAYFWFFDLLPDMESASSRISMFVDEDATTRIELNKRQASGKETVFDLQGRRVENAMQKGVYIKGKKKIIVN